MRIAALVSVVTAAVLVVNGCVSGGGTEGVRLASGGKAAVEIVVAADASPAEKLALKELETCLEKITGADFAVVGERDFKGGKAALYLGQTKFAARAGVDFAKLGEEDMVIKTTGGGLILAGGRPRGTLYAVYEFLERHAGCHWLAWDTTVTPNNPELAVGAVDFAGKPAFSPRGVYVAGERFGGGAAAAKYREFLLRNRGQLEWEPTIGGPLEYNAGYPHTFYLFVDPAKWFASHPEYYSMGGDGKRTFGNPGPRPGAAGSELCLSNPELPGVMAASVLAYIKDKEPGFAAKGFKPGVVDISAEDNASFICKCPACAAISKEEGSESGLLLRFVNQVADLVAKERPDIKVRTLSYVSTDVAPLRAKARDNVIVWWCDLYGKSDCFRPLEHPVNKGQLELLRGWANAAGSIQIWDYWNMGSAQAGPAVPEFIPVKTIAANARLFRASKVSGGFAEFEMGVTGQNFFELDVWAGMRLMFDPDLSADNLTDQFMGGYYGPAAKPMRAFHDMLEKAMMAEPESMDYSHSAQSRAYLNMEFLTACRAALLEAEAATAPGSLERLHVWKEMLVVYNCVLNQWARMKRQNGHEFPFPKTETLEKYAQMREAVITHRLAGTKLLAKQLEDLRTEMECLRSSLPLPERFKGLADGDVVDFPYVKLPSWALREDADATGGKAVYYHVTSFPGSNEGAPVFGLYDRPSKRSGPTLTIKDVPADEKYHLYKMGTFTLGRDTTIWGHGSWGMGCVYLASAYVNADGMKDNPNEWDVYISAKATGPLYVPGSKKENALWCDRVLLVKPGKGK